MKLLRIICDNYNVDGVVIGQNEKAYKVLTTDNKCAVIPKSNIVYTMPLRDLNLKETVEVESLGNVHNLILEKQEQLRQLQEEIAELNAFAQEQEAYVSYLLSGKPVKKHQTATAKKPARKSLNYNELCPDFTENHYKALKFLTDSKMITMDKDGYIYFAEALQKLYPNDWNGMSKSEFIGILDSVFVKIIPLANIINKFI